MREHGALSRVAVGWGENTVGQSAPSEPAACFVGGRISERIEEKRLPWTGIQGGWPPRRLRQCGAGLFRTTLGKDVVEYISDKIHNLPDELEQRKKASTKQQMSLERIRQKEKNLAG